ncbi:MAG: tetratricopeptide repeat protein [Candidatus Heimdallarchaeota archaeon]|nr:tetratricopeptide repeat protein [Candidatus Heimdallarchaeota archaeon]
MASLDFLTELYENSKFEEIVLEVQKLDSAEINLPIENMRIVALRKLGRYEEALKIIDTIKFLPKDSTISKLSYHNIEMDVLTHMGRYKEGSKRITTISELLEEIEISTLVEDEKLVVAQSYNELARLNFFLSEYGSALDNLQQVLGIAKELDNKEKITSSLQNIGSTYLSLGEYVEAIEYLDEALSIAKEMNSIHLIGHIEDNIGLVYLYQGKLDQSLELLNSSLGIHTRIKELRGMGFNYEYIGLVKLKQNSISEALDNFKKSYEIRNDLGNDTHTASIVFALVTTYLEIGERDKSVKYLKELEGILNRTKTKRIQMQYQLAEAVYLKDSKIFRNKVKAETLLRGVIEEPDITEFTYTIAAYLHLIDILYEQIKQLELGGPDKLLDEVEGIFSEIEEYAYSIGEIAETKNLPDLKVSHFNIMGFIAISKFDVTKASTYFNQAEEICRNYDLTNVRYKFKEIDHHGTKEQNQQLVMTKEAFPHKIQKSLNKIIHSLPRLLIVTSLLKNIKLTFTELIELTKMTPGNLGKHCEKLIETGYVHKGKEFFDTKFVTTYTLTPEGLNEFNKYTDILIPFLTSAQTA